jgi:outer membrane cobalamin receptor
MVRPTRTLAILLLSSSAVPVFAAEPPARGVRDTVTSVPGVQVRGDRTGSEPGRGTGTVQRMARADLARFLPTTTADALASAPGVDLVKTGPWASRVSYRGMSGERVLVLVDGVRLDTGRGHGGQTSLVAAEQLDAVELTPGSGGAEHGSGAVGGVVHLITQRPLFADRAQGNGQLQTTVSDPGGERRQSGRVRWLSRHLGFELSGAAGTLAGLATPSGLLANSGSDEQDWGARVATRVGAFRADFEHRQHKAWDIGLPAFGTLPTGNGRYPLQGRDADRLELAWGGRGDAPRVRLLAVDQRFRSHFDETTTDTTFRFGRPVAVTTRLDADRVVTRARSLQPRWQFGEAWRVTVHGEYRRESTEGPRTTDWANRTATGVLVSEGTDLGESVPPAWREGLAAAVSLRRELGGWRFEGGGRWDRSLTRADSTPVSFTSELSTEDERTSGEFGIARAFGAWEGYAHAASGFRVPNLEERYYNNDIHGGLRLFGNPGLAAERSRSLELGVRARDAWGGRLRELRASLYRSEVDDLISFRYVGMVFRVPRFQYQNVAEARLEGAELSARFAVGRGFTAVHASLPRGIDRESGDRLSDIGAPRLTVDVGGPLLARHPLRWAARARWSGRIEDATASEVAAASLSRPASLTFAWETSATLWDTRVTLAVRNLTNHRHREPMSFLEEPGRTFALSLRRDFAWTPPARSGKGLR